MAFIALVQTFTIDKVYMLYILLKTLYLIADLDDWSMDYSVNAFHLKRSVQASAIYHGQFKWTVAVIRVALCDILLYLPPIFFCKNFPVKDILISFLVMLVTRSKPRLIATPF